MWFEQAFPNVIANYGSQYMASLTLVLPTGMRLYLDAYCRRRSTRGPLTYQWFGDSRKIHRCYSPSGVFSMARARSQADVPEQAAMMTVPAVLQRTVAIIERRSRYTRRSHDSYITAVYAHFNRRRNSTMPNSELSLEQALRLLSSTDTALHFTVTLSESGTVSSVERTRMPSTTERCFSCGVPFSIMPASVTRHSLNGEQYCSLCIARCAQCDCVVERRTPFRQGSMVYCSAEHAAEHGTICGRCGSFVQRELVHPVVVSHERHEESWCRSCHSQYAISCEECGTTTDSRRRCHPPQTSIEDLMNGHSFNPARRVFVTDGEESSMRRLDAILGSAISTRLRSADTDRPRRSRPSGRTRVAAAPADPKAPIVPTPPLLFGLELEVEIADATRPRSTLLSISNEDVVFKRDGSLRNGVEIVSSPFSWRWWRETGEARWLERIAALRAAGFRSFTPNTCGLHIHVSRKQFSSLALFRIMSLVYDNADRFIWLSQRNRFDYCHFDDSDANSKRQRIAKARNPNSGWNRYVAVNIPSTHPTVEFRLWRGTLNPSSFLKSVEATHAIVTFATTHGMHEMTWNNFVRYAYVNQMEYPSLAAFLDQSAPNRIIRDEVGGTRRAVENAPSEHARTARVRVRGDFSTSNS